MGYWRSKPEYKETVMINKVLIIGNLGEKPELKHLPNGTEVANFSVATTENWVKDNKKESKTTWHKIKIFGKQAANCEKYLDKGSKVYVEGKIDNRSYEKDGVKRYFTEIQARDVKFLSTNQDVNKALVDAGEKKDYKVASDTDFASDDIPF